MNFHPHAQVHNVQCIPVTQLNKWLHVDELVSLHPVFLGGKSLAVESSFKVACGNSIIADVVNTG